ncbi:hypothetical protein PsYK624_028980 [Phanerochaete sordida]|uniref:Uncharacterized protein n=1 Tax=Phanerochaete sordida TaxID=48140 RepID=A0A9P3L964_9APHY|nr:hypothetical protein PsYK624_028980 [Phanerochaete sordida]
MSDLDLDAETQKRLLLLLPALLTIQRASWEQGCTAQALLEAHQSLACLPKNLFLQYLYGFAHDAAVRQADDGRLAAVLNGDGTTDQGAVDPACIGETFYYLLDLQDADNQELSQEDAARFTSSVEGMLSYILDRCPRAPISPDRTDPADVLLSHRMDCIQIWSDAVYMLPPFLASAAVYYARRPHPAYDPTRLLTMALRQIDLAAQALQSPCGLWSHIFDLRTYEFRRRAFWGVGNGWVCGGIVRVLSTLADALQGAHSGALAGVLAVAPVAELVQSAYRVLTLTLNACLCRLRPDGLFHNVLDDAASFVETNLAQQLSYTLFRLLDLHTHAPARVRSVLRLPPLDADTRARWERDAARMHDAACRKTDRWGFVRDVCGSPRFDKAGTAAEGQAWAIAMEVARYRYLNATLAGES